LVFFQPFGRGKINHHHRQEEVMKSSIRDKAEGTLHEVKGKVKEVTGKITDNPKLEAEGKAEKIAGSWKEPSEKGMIVMRKTEKGKVGWILLWLLGIPIPILLLLYLLRGCT
jgi:uncharacterized protein YjbJ (UPF0337 family)